MNLKDQKRWIFVALLGTAIGCGGGQVKPDAPAVGKVKVVKEKEVANKKTGEISVTVAQEEELAERSTADKGAEALLTPQRVADVGTFFSSYSVGPDSSIVASVYNQEGREGSDVWIFRGGKIRLTKTGYFHYAPSFSSDGKQVYFVSSRGKNSFSQYDQNSYIWRMPSNGAGGITRIGTPAFRFYGPVESPDGEKILAASREFYENSPFVWYMQKNGSLPTQLKQGWDARWLNGESIVLSSKDENSGLYSVWTCNIDGSNLTQIIADAEMDCIHPTPSADGKYLSYVKQKPMKEEDDERATLESRDVFIYRFEDGLSQQVTTNISRDDLPQWSPDGEYLFFRSSRGLSWNIWRISTKFLSQ